MIPRPIVCVSGGSFTSDAFLDKYFLVAYDRSPTVEKIGETNKIASVCHFHCSQAYVTSQLTQYLVSVVADKILRMQFSEVMVLSAVQ